MVRRVERSDGLRQLLIDLRQRRLEQWNNRNPPGWPVDRAPMRDPTLEALNAGEPVVLHSDALFSAFHDAGLPVDRLCHDGPDCGKLFQLDEHDQLLELPAG